MFSHEVDVRSTFSVAEVLHLCNNARDDICRLTEKSTTCNPTLQSGRQTKIHPRWLSLLVSQELQGRPCWKLLRKPTTAAYPWKVYGVARKPQPRWLKGAATEDGSHTADESQRRGVFHHIQCDLSDRVYTLHKLSGLKDVTQLLWLTWAMGGKEEEQTVELNGRMYQNALDALVQEEGGYLEHIAVQTGGKYYTGPFSAAGKVPEVPMPDIPWREHEPRRPGPNFYYTLVDMTLEAVKKSGGKITWTEHRPSAIFGFAPCNLMNLVGTIATYALICKEDNMPFLFPGSRYAWTCLFDCSDSGLIAERELWAALTPEAKNQSFNISNGDFFTLKVIWQRVGEWLGLEDPEYQETSFTLPELMKDKAATWDAIVAKYNLEPTTVTDVGHWWVAAMYCHMPCECVMSMNKTRKFGFMGWRDTEESLLST